MLAEVNARWPPSVLVGPGREGVKVGSGRGWGSKRRGRFGGDMITEEFIYVVVWLLSECETLVCGFI